MDVLDKIRFYLHEADQDFEKAFEKWLKGAQKIIDDHAKKQGKGDKKVEDVYRSVLEVKKGPKYYKIIAKPVTGAGAPVWAFIDKSTGNVLKPASYSAPAKHARGNIYDKSGGLASLSAYGPAYLR